MNMNGVLEKLGFGPRDRVALIHVDDLGMAGGELSAFEDLADSGLLVSGSAMVPCAGFPEVAAWYRRHPEADLGIHLTLTSEWDSPRWAPLTNRDTGPGLRDDQGFFHATREKLFENASIREMVTEMEAQLQRAREVQFLPTHLDSHMYVGFRPELMPAYLDLAESHDVTAFAIHREVFPSGNPGWQTPIIRDWAAHGLCVFDYKATMKNRGFPEDRLAQAKANLDELPPGLSAFLIHPVKDPGGKRAVTPDWQHRCNDYEAFLHPELRKHLLNTGIQLIDYRTLRRA